MAEICGRYRAWVRSVTNVIFFPVLRKSRAVSTPPLKYPPVLPRRSSAIDFAPLPRSSATAFFTSSAVEVENCFTRTTPSEPFAIVLVTAASLTSFRSRTTTVGSPPAAGVTPMRSFVPGGPRTLAATYRWQIADEADRVSQQSQCDGVEPPPQH